MLAEPAAGDGRRHRRPHRAPGAPTVNS
jgi:hypothetical protein